MGSCFAWIWMWAGLGLSWRMLSIFTWETSLAIEIALQSEIPLDETKKESYLKTQRGEAPRHTSVDHKTSYQSYARIQVMVDQFQNEKLTKSD
ncbi:hypothetical protein Ancab_026379 [Ancistrocladus abbreviatus]